MEEKYKNILQLLDCAEVDKTERIGHIIRNELKKFVHDYSQVAIYGNGEHTHMLMVDYVYELKGVKYIIDNRSKQTEDSGYEIIGEDQIEEKGIDAVIISSTTYRSEMKTDLQIKHPQTAYLDLYDKLEEQGIYLNTTFYRYWSPANHYTEINSIKSEIIACEEEAAKKHLYGQLLRKYILIKDFRLALTAMKDYGMVITNQEYQELYDAIKDLYDLQLQMTKKICSDNVLMLCMDGFRRQDYIKGYLPKVKKFCDIHTTFFSNVYACSTSTYESLIPAYSENDDLRTRYYDRNEIEEKNCSFVQEARRQGRKIYFYTDSDIYINCDAIQRKEGYFTVTEKLWYFLLDALEERNGLFYIHILYESHFSYVNPYTLNLVADGTNIMFDYMPRRGGKIRTDYVKQQQESLRYLDDTLAPFLEQLNLRMVLFADHGNILLNQEEKLEEIEASKFSYHEDLIQIPLAVKMPEMNNGQNNQLTSLMSLNEIIICLLNKTKFVPPMKEFIKVERSAIYNPDFHYLYKKAGKERELQAFEVFIFQSGYKLAIYENGEIEAFLIQGDELVEDDELVQELLCKVHDHITVCDRDWL